MSPVRTGPRPGSIRAVTVAVVGVLLTVIVGVVFVQFALGNQGNDGIEIRLGDERFNAGQVDRISAEVDDRGPILFSDVSGGDLDIILNHTAADPTEGWIAFEARPAGVSRDCFLRWQPDRDLFVDTCDGATTYPPEGTGLRSFPTEVVDGEVLVDLTGSSTTSTSSPAGS